MNDDKNDDKEMIIWMVFIMIIICFLGLGYRKYIEHEYRTYTRINTIHIVVGDKIFTTKNGKILTADARGLTQMDLHLI